MRHSGGVRAHRHRGGQCGRGQDHHARAARGRESGAQRGRASADRADAHAARMRGAAQHAGADRRAACHGQSDPHPDLRRVQPRNPQGHRRSPRGLRGRERAVAHPFLERRAARGRGRGRALARRTQHARNWRQLVCRRIPQDQRATQRHAARHSGARWSPCKPRVRREHRHRLHAAQGVSGPRAHSPSGTCGHAAVSRRDGCHLRSGALLSRWRHDAGPAALAVQRADRAGR